MNSISQCRPLLGTFVEIDLEGPLSDGELMDRNAAAFAEIERIEGLLSYHDPDSELSRANREGWERPMVVSEDFGKVISLALELSRLTDGSYDLTIAPELVQFGMLPECDHVNSPDSDATWEDLEWSDADRILFFRKPLNLDLGGIAKGYAVDQAIEALGEGVVATVNAGGDLRMTHWRGKRVLVRRPGNSGMVELEMRASALATSALDFREKAIIDPATRQPISEERSVSVFASTCLLADALTKVAFLAPNAAEVLGHFQSESIFLNERGEMVPHVIDRENSEEKP